MLAALVVLAVQVSVVSASPRAGNTLRVTVAVTNDGDAPYALRDADLVVLDAGARRFAARDVTDEIPAGETRSVEVLFFVPADLHGELLLEAGALAWTSPPFTDIAENGGARAPAARPRGRTRNIGNVDIPLGPLFQGLF